MKKVLKNIKNILINFIIIVLVLVAILVIYSFIQLNILNKEYVNIFGYSIFQIETGSMSNTIEIDDIIIIKLGNNDISENDIVTYKNGKDFITHRVINIEDDSIIAKGDNNNIEDDPVNINDVIGKVVFIFHDIRIWKAVFSDISVIIPICITLVLLILLISYKEKVGEKDD